MKMKLLGLTVGLSLITSLAWWPATEARQFRTVKKIVTPLSKRLPLPEGAVAAASVKAVPRKSIEKQMSRLLDKWNSPVMRDTLAKEFYDRTRLLDSVDTTVPKDAKLRLVGVQGSQTLQQYYIPASEQQKEKEVSIVSATVRTQLEYNGKDGFVGLPGTNEYILKVVRTRK